MFPLHWDYSPSDPAPPTPHVVLGAPVDTTPLNLPQPRTAPTFDRDAPCPATPCCVPSMDLPEVGTSQSSNGSSYSIELTYPWPGDLQGGSNDQDQNQQNNPVTPIDPHYAFDTYQWPSPVVAIIQRASLDSLGYHARPVNPFVGPQPIRLFAGGAGADDIDFLSFQYYTPWPCVPSRSSCIYPIRCIEAVQHSLSMDWSRVVPQPIPPVIIRLCDLVGNYDLKQHANGCAFVVPAADSIWAVLLQRGVDSEYRFINPRAAISTHRVLSSRIFYNLQHAVASAFAVNVFLELQDATGQNQCEYLGAYILQLMDTTTISRFHWGCIDPRERQAIFERIPEHFTVCKDPLLGWPHLPFIQFRYYKWDEYILRMADKSRYGMNLAPAPYIPCPA